MTPHISHKAALAAGFIAGAGALALGATLAALHYRSREFDRRRAPAAAFAGEGAHPDSFVQTRDAGPDHIRDEDGSDWDDLDQASDESFPSSDPPATNDFRTPAPINYGPETKDLAEDNMEEAEKGQDVEDDRKPAGDPTPVAPSVAPHAGKPDAKERRMIAEGQAQARRDADEMRKAGFGGHIGTD